MNQAFADDGSSALGLLVDYKILDEAAASNKIMVSPDEIAAKRAELIGSVGSDNFNKQVALHRIDPKLVDDKIRHGIILEKLAALQAPPKELMVHVRQILIATQPTRRGVDLSKPHSDAAALAIVARLEARLKEGANFTDLARKYSEDPYTRADGGDLGIIDEHSDPFNGTVWNAALGLTNGQSSNKPVHSYLGYHLIQVVSWSNTPISSDVAAYLSAEKRTSDIDMPRLMNATMARLRSSAKVDESLFSNQDPINQIQN